MEDLQIPAVNVQLALGRLFRLMSRPEQPGDVAQYHHLRDIIMDGARAEERQPGPLPGWNFGRGANGCVE